MQAQGGDVIPIDVKKLALFSLLVLGGTAADQITKFIIFTRLGGEGQSKRIIGGLLSLTCRRNTGAVFGLFPGCNEMFIALTAVAIVVIAVFFLKNAVSAGWVMTAAVALIMAGALGNLVDRLLFRNVRDFIDLHVWPVFNLADVLICAGALGLAYTSLISKKDKESGDGSRNGED